MNRRRFLRTAGAFVAAAIAPPAARSQGRPLRYADMHSHIGIRGTMDIRGELAGNGMLLVARKIVADGPVIGSVPGQGWRLAREPAPGELSAYFDRALARLREQHRREGLAEVASAAALERLRGGSAPGVVLAAEGGDFLEGDLKRLEAARTAGLVHLQLVHYRVSELGDIATERPVHGGLTAFGKEAIASCNRLGILVDVAHGTSALIEQALSLAARPVVYSHGHVTSSEPHYTQNPVRARAIHKPMAEAIAKKGGVVGIWPLGSMYRTLDAYAGALIDAAEALGAAHVGVGTDVAGLPSSVMPGYAEFPALEEALARRGIKAGDIEGMLGGNYLRVLGRSLAG
jgi:membrane dipeptidase